MISLSSNFKAPHLLAVGIPLLALGLHLWPGAAEGWQWQRGAGGSIPCPAHLGWLTSHLVHWSWGHLVWDVVAFVLLSAVSLKVRPAGYVPTLLIAAALIPLEVRLFQPQFQSYRGLSGLDTALFGLAVAGLWKVGTRRSRALAAVAAAGLVGKTGFEMLTGTTLFAPEEPGLYTPVPSAHLVGFAVGMVCGWMRHGREVRGTSQPAT